MIFRQTLSVRPKKQATMRYETKPGKQDQMDWGHVGKFEIDTEFKVIYALRWC